MDRDDDSIQGKRVPKPRPASAASGGGGAARPTLINLHDYEVAATHGDVLPAPVREYFRSGALDERGVEDNRSAMREWRIRPRFLVDVAEVDTSTTLLGARVASPVAVAPSAMQRMATDEGECASAAAAAAEGVAYCLSSWGNTLAAEVATAHDAAILAAQEEGGARGVAGPPRWMQLYVVKDREVTRRLVRNAEAADFSAVVLTIDRPVLGLREADARSGFAMPTHLRLPNVGLTSDDAHAGVAIDASLTWADVSWLTTISKLPVVVKGVMTGEDAALAVAYGCAGVWVSNHGGRQMESTGGALSLLPEVVRAVGGAAEVYVDGGFRRGEDVFKALCLGARAVFIGRPVVWGLAVGGRAGAAHVVRLLADELRTTMQLAGTASVSDLGRHSVARM